jgi:hypothetical protein
MAAPDPVAEGSHGDKGSGDHEPIDVDDPKLLGAARLKVRADGRQCEVEDGQIHYVQHARQRDTASPIHSFRPARGVVALSVSCCIGHRTSDGDSTVGRRSAPKFIGRSHGSSSGQVVDSLDPS